MPLNRPLLLIALVVFPRLTFAQDSAIPPITPAGERLTATLDKMDVAHKWIAGQVVAWKTGKPLANQVADTKPHTHCSAFAAAAGEKLGIYLLHPPEHSSSLLANAQYDWLPSDEGRKNGWKAVAGGIEAQSLANRGFFVVAVYKESDPKKHGHIAVIRPDNRDAARVKAVGPAITQAGMDNFASGDLREGFKHHRGAFPNAIRYYAHNVKE